MEFKLEIGIDIAKRWIDTAWMNPSGKYIHHSLKYDPSGIGKLLQKISALGVRPEEVLVCMEHTGVYIEKLVRVLHAEGFFVWVVCPYIIKTNNVGIVRIKSDKADARKICDFARVYHESAKRYTPKTAVQDRLESLFLLRRQLVKDRQRKTNQQINNRDKAVPNLIADRIAQNLIEYFTEQIKMIDQALEAEIKKDPRLRRILKILLSIPSIGPVTANYMIILTEGFRKITSWRSFACFIGTAPFGKSSGNKKIKRTRVSKMGHRKIKAVLNMAVLRQIRPGGFYRDQYEEMISGSATMKAKHHLSAMNAIKNKVIKIAFDLVRLDQEFDPEIYLSNKRKTAPKLNLS